ncbi:unnamed protein product [Mytilus edulis]|uniref:ZP domain-containing protein n=1 Tax=Mytilus edulis TaxID=6550 RepID=A0A8S3QJW9_MYTED|nr:unnamed protein product [Mytilus edulis]
MSNIYVFVSATSTLRGWWSSTFTPSSTPTPLSKKLRIHQFDLINETTSTLRRWWTSDFTTSSTPTPPSCKLMLPTQSNWYIRLYIRPLKQQFQGFNAGDVYLGRDSCTGYESGDYIIFSEEYNSCLTDKSTSNDAVIYTNTLVYALHDPDHRFIIRDYRFKVKVECDMSKREHGVDTIKHNHGHEDHTAAGTGHFSIHLNFIVIQNIKIGLMGFLQHMWLVMLSICPVDRNTYITSQSTHETRFHFQDFEYAGHPDSMFVHCNATFCKSNDYSSECEPQCKHSKRIGHHRSAVQNLNGPIEIAEVETKILFTDKRGKFLYYEMFKALRFIKKTSFVKISNQYQILYALYREVFKLYFTDITIISFNNNRYHCSDHTWVVDQYSE